MARILVDGEWFEQVAPSTFMECDLEARILLHAPSIYPDYHVLPFKKVVDSDFGSVKGDLAFVSKDYSEWRIVEVEMGYHTLSAHVEPQVQRLANASYGAEEAQYLSQKLDAFDPARLTELVEQSQPELLVIVNEPKPDWVKPLRRYGAGLTVFELFRSESEQEIFRVDGEYPCRRTATVSECYSHPLVSRLLEVRNPDVLQLPPRGRIKLRYEYCMTEWERTDAEGKVWLCPVGRSPLVRTGRYVLFAQADSTLMLLSC